MPGGTQMSVKNRALLIGLAGSAVQAMGIAWALIHLLISHVHDPLSARHLIFEPPFLLIFVGFLVTMVCLPVALEVSQATPEEVALPRFGDEDDELGLEGPSQAVKAGQ